MSASIERARAAAVLVTAVAMIALVGAFSASARAEGVTIEQLQAHGWVCFPSPVVPDRIGCFDPGRGRPFPGNPDPAPTYDLLAFSASSGEFVFTVHLIRADLYSGQPCGDHSYVFRALIGYYECVHA